MSLATCSQRTTTRPLIPATIYGVTLAFFDAYSVVPEASAIAAIGCEIIELQSYGTVGVERNPYVRLKPKAGDTRVDLINGAQAFTVGAGGTGDQKPNSRADTTGSI